MKRFVATFLVSLFLGAGIALAGGGGATDQPQQQSMPQSKIVVNVPEPENNWTIPVAVAVVGGLATVGAAWVARSRRKGD